MMSSEILDFANLLDLADQLFIIASLGVPDQGADGVQHPHAVMRQVIVAAQLREVGRLDLGVRSEKAEYTIIILTFTSNATKFIPAYCLKNLTPCSFKSLLTTSHESATRADSLLSKTAITMIR